MLQVGATGIKIEEYRLVGLTELKFYVSRLEKAYGVL
jgi:hypothetical protein